MDSPKRPPTEVEASEPKLSSPAGQPTASVDAVRARIRAGKLALLKQAQDQAPPEDETDEAASRRLDELLSLKAQASREADAIAQTALRNLERAQGRAANKVSPK